MRIHFFTALCFFCFFSLLAVKSKRIGEPPAQVDGLGRSKYNRRSIRGESLLVAAGQGTSCRRKVASLPFSASPFQSAFRQRASLERGSRRMSETENGFTLSSMVGQRHPARLREYGFAMTPTL